MLSYYSLKIMLQDVREIECGGEGMDLSSKYSLRHATIPVRSEVNQIGAPRRVEEEELHPKLRH